MTFIKGTAVLAAASGPNVDLPLPPDHVVTSIMVRSLTEQTLVLVDDCFSYPRGTSEQRHCARPGWVRYAPGLNDPYVRYTKWELTSDMDWLLRLSFRNYCNVETRVNYTVTVIPIEEWRR